jgi:hypothetical protein
LKTCSKCKEGKPLEAFSKNVSKRDGLQSCCKACDAARKKANSEEEKARKAAWKKANRERVNSGVAAWQKANPEKIAAKTAKRKAAKLQATPAWANQAKIAELYAEAQTMPGLLGEPCHVDHIVPLKSKIVCGLHCESNLQVLPGLANIIKGNRVWPDMP